MIDLSPLKNNRDYRCLYLGQFVSFFGTMMSLVALPYQIYHLTGSTLAVGLLGIVELVPLLLTAFVGGALADVMDRRKLLICAELGMAVGCLFLVGNALLVAIQYALGRQELLGTYIIDFVAMIFAMPNALFPALAVIFGGTKALGWLYAAPAIGALFITIFSSWTKKINRHGAAVALAAIMWGCSIACVGMSNQFLLVIFFLILAGAADCVSGIFRTTIWNETIPDKLRGRMASLEMVSYMSGPLIGNAQVGFIAAMTSTQIAILTGGTLCVAAVIVSIFLLPAFWKYHSQTAQA